MFKKENRISIPGIILRILIILLAAGMFGYAAWQMFGYVSENRESDESRDNLADKAVTILIPETSSSPLSGSTAETDPDFGSVSSETSPDLSRTIPIWVDFDILQEEHPDIIAWIYCPNTPINYPIVQGDNNQYYVSHMPDGKYNAAGSIFLDFRNSGDLTDLNSLIYGHNMTNNAMFASLNKYKNQSYYDEHPIIWIVTREVAYRIDLIGGCVTSADSDAYTIFSTEEQLAAYLQKLPGKSTFTSAVDMETVTRIVTLSTCSYEYNAARYIVIGSMVPIEYPADIHTQTAKN